MVEAPTATYVTKLLNTLQNELFGVHAKVVELERLRYFEDDIALSTDQRMSGIEIRIGMTADLVESVKSTMGSSPPKAFFRALSTTDPAKNSATMRTSFWNEFLEHKLSRPTPVLLETLDSMVGTGYAVLKGALGEYPKDELLKLPNETAAEHLDRVKELKRYWGPPIDVDNPHILGYYYRFGRNRQVVESLEHSWKPRPEVFRALSLSDSKELRQEAEKFGSARLNKSTEELANAFERVAMSMAGTSGVPQSQLQSLPIGIDATTKVLVTEYWSPDWYQVYVNRRLVYQMPKPTVRYFLGVGQVTSSKDPDKTGQSVAEILRHNESTVNRLLTRMAEAAELLVRKRLAIEVPESDTTTGVGEIDEASGLVKAQQFRFAPDAASVLPAGAKVVDPYESAQYVFQAMPVVQLLMQVLNEHGTAPIFKGRSPGQGSGYRDNSLYAMARNKYEYLQDNYEALLTDFIRWCETVVAENMTEKIYMGEYEIDPAEIRKYPCDIEIIVTPNLPQNTIAEGEFWMGSADRGYASRRRAQTQGLHIENPQLEDREVLLDAIKRSLQPTLLADVLSSVGAVPGGLQPPGATGGPPPNGVNPVGSAADGMANLVRERAGNANGGRAGGGEPHQPSQVPGTTVGATPPPSPMGAPA